MTSLEPEIEHLKQQALETISTISHGLRNRIATLYEGLDLVLSGIDGPLTQDQQDTLTITKKNVDKLIELTEQLGQLKTLVSDLSKK